MGDVKITMTLEDKGVAKKVEDLDRALDDLGKTGTGTKGAVRSFGSELTSGLIPSFTAASLAADGIKRTLRFLKDQFVETMGAAIEAEKVDRALESSLQIVGQAGGGAAEILKGYASALQRKTIYSDEAIKSAQALIIQMRGTASQVDVVMRGAVGLAAVFEMDLNSAAKAVAQGFEGNYRAIGMLIPAVREATTEGEKHAAMVKALSGYYQRAEADAGTFSGLLDQLKNAYDDVQEVIGGFVTKNKTVIDTLTGVKDVIIWVERAAKSLSNNAKQSKAFFEMVVPGLAGLNDIIKIAKKANDDYASSWEGWTASFLSARKMAIDPIPIIIREKLILPLTESQRVIQDEIRWLRMLGSANIIPAISKNFGTLGDMVGGTLGTLIDFQETVPGLFEGLKTGAADAGNSATGMADVWETALQSMTAGLVSFGDANASVWSNIGSVFSNFIKSALGGMEAMWIRQILISKGIVKAKQGEATASHISNIFASVPFPFDLILAAGAFAVVNALFSKLLKFDKGGFADRPTLAVFGHGPEYALPEARLERLIERTVTVRERTLVGAGAGGGFNVAFGPGSIVINARTLDDATIRNAGSRIFREIEGQIRIGRRLNG